MIQCTPAEIPARDVFSDIDENEAVLRYRTARRFELIARACDEWRVDESLAFEGAERAKRGGADGTAHVGEFLCVELAGRFRCSVARAASLISDALNLRDRHPRLWRAVLDLRVDAWQATRITRDCANAGLTREAAGWVDTQVEIALKLQSFGQVMRMLPKLIVQADPVHAVERAEAQRTRRTARILDHRDGHTTFFACMDAAAALHLDQTLSDLANVLAAHGDTDTTEQRRATALGLLAEPARAATLLAGGDPGPTERVVKLFVHLPAGSVTGRDDCIADIEGSGVLTRETLIEFLGTSRITVQPVIDHDRVAPVDGYAVPPRMREAVINRNPTEVFPWSHKPARGCELDHTVPFDHQAPPGSGQTRPDNLGPLGKRVHRAKTHGGWRVKQLESGVFHWISRAGFHSLVTPRGTHDLGRQPTHLPTSGNSA